ncbi:OLC1v1012446C1 [Oldenlandia corymbosa var. corymbosa]|uniref:OLC1v1012446C1 n=1 Tax=Oldenlandia corymbosa var. corymbosa TaxID=529605 RepID=A0AAV1DVY4_OLDCO|nr:OLC1v1012446C1 [Oldenlandia corymbosa var. corymbosa]
MMLLNVEHEVRMKLLNIIAQKRLAKPNASTIEPSFKRPNEVLRRYQKSNPSKAIVLFRQVLRENPSSVLQTSLVGMYSAGGDIADAHQVFEEMSTRNVVSWIALIAASVNNQKEKIGLELFGQMQLENVEPDHVTLAVALSVCADIGELGIGEEI